MKTYIFCPSYISTGGIELIHQFQYKLNMLGFDTYIYYSSVEEGRNPILDVYKKYNVKYTQQIEDSPENIVVFPEIFIELVPMLDNVKKVVWWMSVDNAKGSEESFEYMWNNTSIIHLVQSQYAMEYLQEKGVSDKNIRWLSDYINSEYLHVNRVSSEARGPVVLFNPRKGYDMTSRIIQKSRGNIHWVALSGFDPQSMRDLMRHSRVYIDFGNHPGRDRIPREASMCGCLVITNKKGAARNSVDVLIDSNYKFDEDAFPEDIVDTIIKLVSEYDSRTKDYEKYNARTAREFQQFELDLYNIFSDLTGTVANKEDARKLKDYILDCIYSENILDAYRTLIKYKAFGYEEDTELIILEANIRISMGEKYEAEYILKEELTNVPDNYEIMLMLAGIHAKLNTKEDLLLCVDECQQAMQYSENTPDADVVMKTSLGIISDVKAALASL